MAVGLVVPYEHTCRASLVGKGGAPALHDARADRCCCNPYSLGMMYVACWCGKTRANGVPDHVVMGCSVTGGALYGNCPSLASDASGALG